MDFKTISALRSAIEANEKQLGSKDYLYKHKDEFYLAPHGISVIVPVKNGGSEMDGLLYSLMTQTLGRHEFEVIFSLNGCSDNSLELIQTFCRKNELSYTVLESEQPSISKARNKALECARFRFTTFVDHDDCLSRAYLEECIRLANYRSIVVSNILRVEHGRLGPDYAQEVISDGFWMSNVHSAEDIDFCFRAYTLNAIKIAPTYMLRRIQYDESLMHCEDIKYWRDVFHAFLPITVKSPTWRDIYYRTFRPRSASRGHLDINDWASPRIKILKQIESESGRYTLASPQRVFDRHLEQLLRRTLAHEGISCPTETRDSA